MGVAAAALVLGAAAASADEHEPAWQDRLNLNPSTRQEFGEIPGVGNRMVREFM